MPDANRLSQIKQNVSALMQSIGQTAVWRDYVSASGASGEYGLGTAHIFAARTITGVFAPIRPQEILAAGGFYQFGDLRITTFEQIGAQDEVIFEGARYQIVSSPIPVTLWGTPANETIFRRA